jgi:hypothetical protein
MNRKIKNDGEAIAQVQKKLGKLQRGRRQRRKRQQGALAKIPTRRQARRGDGNATMNYRQRSPHQVQFSNYLRCVASPWTVCNALIPDWTTFPRSSQQIRTVGKVHVGDSGQFMFTVYPGLFQAFNFVSEDTTNNATITVDGVEYGEGATAGSIFNCHDYTNLSASLDAFRMVSMGVKLEPIAPVLVTGGSIACACTPPANDPFITYDQLAEYNYTKTIPFNKGCCQIYMTAGIQAFDSFPPDAEFGSDDMPAIQIAATNLPVDTTACIITTYMNIEAFSNAQFMTATQQSGKPDPLTLSSASQALSESHKSGGLSGPLEAAGKLSEGIISKGVDAAKDMAYSWFGSSVPDLTAVLADLAPLAIL